MVFLLFAGASQAQQKNTDTIYDNGTALYTVRTLVPETEAEKEMMRVTEMHDTVFINLGFNAITSILNNSEGDTNKLSYYFQHVNKYIAGLEEYPKAFKEYANVIAIKRERYNELWFKWKKVK